MSDWWTPKKAGVVPSSLFSYADDKPIVVTSSHARTPTSLVKSTTLLSAGSTDYSIRKSIGDDELTALVRAYLVS